MNIVGWEVFFALSMLFAASDKKPWVWFNGATTRSNLERSPCAPYGSDLVREGGAQTVALRVHLADDHTLFREGLESILSSRGGIEVVGSSSTGEEAAAMVAQTKPDFVITQLDMHLKTTEAALEGIRLASPNSKIVVLTMLDNIHYLKALSRLGIDAYLHKSSSKEELIATIDALSRREGGHNAVISMPRGLLERLGNEPMGGLPAVGQGQA